MAKINAANTWQIFKNIIIPILLSTIFFVVIITVISLFQVFDLIYLMMHGPFGSTNVLVYAIYKNAFEYFNIGKASAIAYGMFVIILFITLLQWHFRKK